MPLRLGLTHFSLICNLGFYRGGWRPAGKLVSICIIYCNPIAAVGAPCIGNRRQL